MKRYCNRRITKGQEKLPDIRSVKELTSLTIAIRKLDKATLNLYNRACLGLGEENLIWIRIDFSKL